MSTSQKKQQNYVMPIIVMFFLFAMISFVTGFQNPFGVILKQQLHWSNALGQLGAALNFIAYLAMGIPAGMLLQRKGYKVSAIAAVLVGLLGVVLMWISSYCDTDTSITVVYCVGALVAGFSMCMLNTVVNPMLNTLGGGGNKGNQLIQFGGVCNSLAATICPIFVGFLIGNVTAETSLVDARPALYVAAGIFLLAFIVLGASKLPEPILDAIRQEETECHETEKQAEPTIREALGFRHLTLGIVAIFVYIAIEIGIPQMANPYMIDAPAQGGIGMNAGTAGVLVGAYWFMMLIGRFVGGIIGGMVSSRQMISVASAVLIVLLLLGMYLPVDMVALFGYEIPLNVLFLVLCGLCTSVMWGGIFNLAVEGLGKYTAVASGLFMTMVCGGALVMIQGLLADSWGYLQSYWLLILFAAYICFYALIGSRVTRRADEQICK